MEDCDLLQADLDSVYDWADANNMLFNSRKFNYVCFSSSTLPICSNVYVSPQINIISETKHMKDLGVYMSSDCMFEHHIIDLYKRSSRLSGWILRTFICRETFLMLTLFKSIILSRLDFGCQLWSPYLLKHINQIESVQRSFTKHISGMQTLTYSERLSASSVQRRRERYIIIYVWKILEAKVPNLSSPILCYGMDSRLGRMCKVSNVASGHVGTLSYHSFRWKAIRLFNNLPKHIRNLAHCSILVFKKKLVLYLSQKIHNQAMPNYNNSLDNKYNLN